MEADSPYTTVVAPRANAQIDAALRWWARNRRAAPHLLVRELEAALDTIEHVPQAGRRTRSRSFRNVRRLLLRGTSYHLYYQINEARRQVRIVHLRHGSRRPIAGR